MWLDHEIRDQHVVTGCRPLNRKTGARSGRFATEKVILAIMDAASSDQTQPTSARSRPTDPAAGKGDALELYRFPSAGLSSMSGLV